MLNPLIVQSSTHDRVRRGWDTDSDSDRPDLPRYWYKTAARSACRRVDNAGALTNVANVRKDPPMSNAAWEPPPDELDWYLGAACGELAQAVCELRPGGQRSCDIRSVRKTNLSGAGFLGGPCYRAITWPSEPVMGELSTSGGSGAILAGWTLMPTRPSSNSASAIATWRVAARCHRGLGSVDFRLDCLGGRSSEASTRINDSL